MNTYIILLAGGSGKRLWPLSTAVRAKHSLTILPDGAGGYESMLDRVYRQLRREFLHDPVVIATDSPQCERIRAHLGDTVHIVCEPARRDTFPAIILSSAYIADICGGSEEDIVIVIPVDVHAEQHYFSTIRRMRDLIADDRADLALMGIRPTDPSSRFGYILPQKKDVDCPLIYRFIEKPDEQTAIQLIAQGACWNGGVFACSLGYLMDEARSRIGTSSYRILLDRYDTLQRISFDYAVVEDAERVAMQMYDGLWRDLGTWDALAQQIGADGIGLQHQIGTERTFIVNELPTPVVALGTQDIIIAANADGILVRDLSDSTDMKLVVDLLSDPPRRFVYAWGVRTVQERSQGGYEVSTVQIHQGHSWHVCAEEHTDITVIVLQGSGDLTDGTTGRHISTGKVVSVPSGQSITIEADQQIICTVVSIMT